MVGFMRGALDLGEPVIQVPMRVSVQVPAGPFTVVVDGVAHMAGSGAPGATASGQMGQQRPARRMPITCPAHLAASTHYRRQSS